MRNARQLSGLTFFFGPSLQKEARSFSTSVCCSKLYGSHHPAIFQPSSTVSCQPLKLPRGTQPFRPAKILVILAYLTELDLCAITPITTIVQLYPVSQSLLVKLVSDLQSLHNARRHLQDTCRAAVDTPYPEKRKISKLPHPHQNIPCRREVEELPN